MSQASLMILILGIMAMCLCMLHDPVIFSTIEDWVKIVAPHLLLVEYIEAMKKSLSSGYTVIALN